MATHCPAGWRWHGRRGWLLVMVPLHPQDCPRVLPAWCLGPHSQGSQRARRPWALGLPGLLCHYTGWPQRRGRDCHGAGSGANVRLPTPITGGEALASAGAHTPMPGGWEGAPAPWGLCSPAGRPERTTRVILFLSDLGSGTVTSRFIIRSIAWSLCPCLAHSSLEFPADEGGKDACSGGDSR